MQHAEKRNVAWYYERAMERDNTDTAFSAEEDYGRKYIAIEDILWI